MYRRGSLTPRPPAGRRFGRRLAASQPGKPARALALDEGLERLADKARFLVNAGQGLRLGQQFVIKGKRGAHFLKPTGWTGTLIASIDAESYAELLANYR